MTYEKYFTAILNDVDVKKDKPLYTIFLKAFAEYQKNQDDAIIARLAHEVSLHLMTNKYKAPQSVVDFMLLGQKELAKIRGKESFLKMLAMSIANMR
ncbi:bacteriocin immunity protein [Streptococcus sp. CSL10205-OR2]|uniref:bacteriocin immunity protein n=1 Tax=Streptococcus sp. CSL10205-OR2 TaxID=2980558 RepID=UPI0021D9CFFC|nr:bacteriocin immunity protein [Streptococcus sp. CSL10205-OR2]MCU9534127.1 bacteriocin immunity protein [Streptococcus sp. CSL10205-OR2]